MRGKLSELQRKRKQDDKENSPFKSPINQKRQAVKQSSDVLETPIKGTTESIPSSACSTGSRKRHGTLVPSSVASNGRVSRDSGSTPPLCLRVSKEEMSRKFEEWMKVAADNKINTSNSWNLALIDYFHDMTILRDGDSVNFQKASCTLDGCVKIYSSRVDSVDYETRKLLFGISEDMFADQATKRIQQEANSDVDEEENGATARRRNGTGRSGNTLEKNFASLNAKKMEVEYMVDPLFKKTSAGFDETGAKSLLLNRLQTSKIGKLIFDATDVTMSLEVAEGTEPQTEPNECSEQGSSNVACSADTFSVSHMVSLIPELASSVEYRTVCPSLSGFLLDDPEQEFVMPSPQAIMENSVSGNSSALDAELAVEKQAVASAAALFDDVSISKDNFTLENATGSPWSDSDSIADEDVPMDPAEPTDIFPEPTPRKQLSRRASLARDSASVVEAELDFNFFDNALRKSWAGPQFYRRRLLRHHVGNPELRTISTVADSLLTEKAERNDGELNVDNEVDEDAPKSKASAGYKIPFTELCSIPSDEEVFSPYKQRLQIKLEKKKKGSHLLPLDTHFTSRDLLRLFLKPSFIVKWRPGLAERPLQETAPAGDRVDDEFWRSANEGALEKSELPILVEPEDKDLRLEYQAHDENAPDFADESEYFHFAAPLEQPSRDEEFDGPLNADFEAQLVESLHSIQDLAEAFPNLNIKGEELSNGALETAPSEATKAVSVYKKFTGATGAGEYGELAHINEAKNSFNSRLSYAKQAKRVDIHLLKANLWREIALDAPKPVSSKSATPAGFPHKMSETVDTSIVEEEGCHKFTGLVTGLKRFYPDSNQLKDISVPFCFICLLHLANEEGLSIENETFGNLDELYVRKN